MTRFESHLIQLVVVLVTIAAGTMAGPAVHRADAQVSPDAYDFARPTLEWFTIETEHFNVVFHHDTTGEGSSRTGQVVARIAEEVYEPITSLYDYVPNDKITVVLKDFEDYSNGAAYFFDNKIEIWAPALDSPLRGEHNWLRNVIAHEFTHMVQVQKSMKAGRRVPFLYVQYLDYEDVRRPDVLYGYPNVIVTYPMPTLNNPAWLAEGTAQYQRAYMSYDAWDSHRDMVLRTRVLAGEELSLAEMGGFYSHSSLEREAVYNQGFAFTQYLARRYGEDVLRRITDHLGAWRNPNVDRAIRDATGDDVADVYADWIGQLRGEYEARVGPIRDRQVAGRLIEDAGFSNFHPRFSPNGRRLAYVSNKGEDFNLMSLYVVDVETGEELSYAIDGLDGGEATYVCSFGYEHKIRSGVGGSVTWHPAGKQLVYARTKTTPEGFRYSDLYRFDLEAEEEMRLTHEARAFSPAYGPDGTRIAFTGQSDGTTNLFLFEVETESVRRLTSFDDGTQIADPAWHPEGRWIYVSRSGERARDLYRVDVESGAMEPVLVTEADERSPAFDADGSALHYASDRSGIFNLYRMPAGREGDASEIAADGHERLTDVIGGAFMPDVSQDGRLAFARFDWDGYKIVVLDDPTALPGHPATSYEPPDITVKQDPSPTVPGIGSHVNAFDDTDLHPLGADAVTRVRTTGRFPLSVGRSDGQGDEEEGLAVERYSPLFTSFSFFPVLRVDNYASRRDRSLEGRVMKRTRAENLWRNTKFGLYVTSREILEQMSLLGGLMVGPGSRSVDGPSEFVAPSNLLKLERDAFLLIDYGRGFGVIPRRWSPQISIELYNIRRNVEEGLTVEEFPCTACYPESTRIDLAYSLWEADLYLRSKVSETLLLEVGYRYSPYRVVTERFFSKEENQFIGESASRYFIGRAFTAGSYFKSEQPHRDSDVLPEQIRVDAHYELETGRLLERFDVEDGMLVPTYKRNRNHRVTLDARAGLRLPGQRPGGAHGLSVRARGSTLLGADVDDFYNDYVGGLVGARGYPFYALGGNETLWFQAAYHFPVLPDISKQVLFAYVDKLYGRVYADAAMAWAGSWPGFGEVRRDAGAELRLVLGSFYLMPTALFVSATYGMDSFDVELGEGFLTPDGSSTVRYGDELLWHFGILFDFEL
ncbi:MAG: hypothetical protein WD423_00870 [Rhodothermales bacterium]